MIHKKQNKTPLFSATGFTLVELAISLVVIGLLLGGILKGRELLDNARTTALAKQLKTYDAAALMFLDRFGAFPGDLRDADTIIPKCETNEAICGVGGNNNRLVGNAMTGDHASTVTLKHRETCKFFTHLYYAEMINAELGSSGTCYTIWATRGADPRDKMFFPPSPFADVLISLRSLGNVFPTDDAKDYLQDSHYYDLYPLSIYHAHAIDKKFDDGYALTGNILVVPVVIPVPDTPCNNSDGVYNLQADNPRSGKCHTLFRASF